MIILRDVREVGIAALLVPVFIYAGWKNLIGRFIGAPLPVLRLAGTWCLTASNKGNKTPDLDGSLKYCAATSSGSLPSNLAAEKYSLELYPAAERAGAAVFCWCTWSMPASVTVRILFLLFLVGSPVVDVFVYCGPVRREKRFGAPPAGIGKIAERI